MDHYGNLSDEGEVDHSFFDSDADEGVPKTDVITGGPSKEVDLKSNGDSHLDVGVKTGVTGHVTGKEEFESGDKVRKDVYEAETAESTFSLADSRPSSAVKSGRSSAHSLRIEATIPTGIPKIRREFEDNYYPDEEDSSEEESHNSRPKTAKQTNTGKKSTGKYSRDLIVNISSSDTECSDSASDDRTYKSYQSLKGRWSPENSSRSVGGDLRDYAEESEDTVTDVTPLSTPDISPIQSFDLAATSEALKSKIKRQENVSQEIYDHDCGQKSNQKALQDAVDLNQLLKAFMHLDKKEQRNLEVEPPVIRNKKNYSFTNEEVRHIDRENQRLLRELSRQAAKPRSKTLAPKKPSTNPTRLYHSALNRQKEQQRIERENLAFLKRLESVKPTVGMTRSEQLMDYQRQAGYLSSTATSPRPGKASVSRLSPSSASGLSRLSSASSRSERTGSSAALLRPTKSSNVRAAWM
ncbi:cilia- and flagella-associated protein 97 [Rhinophrynus dorsalis]